MKIRNKAAISLLNFSAILLAVGMAGCQNRTLDANKPAADTKALGQNLILNGGFEDGNGTVADHWTVWGGASYWITDRNARTGIQAHNGLFCGQIGGVYGFDEYANCAWYPTDRIQVTAGNYVLKFWAKSQPGSNLGDAGQLWVVKSLYDASTDGERLEFQDFHSTLTPPDASGWSEMHFIFCFATDGWLKLKIMTPDIQGNMFLDDVTFQKLDAGERVANMCHGYEPPEIATLTSPLLGTASGAFHTQQIQGSWWLVHPDGEAHFLNGLGFRRWGIYDPVCWSWVETNYSSYPSGTADGYQRYFAMPHINDWGFTGLGSLNPYEESIMNLYENDDSSRRPMHWGYIFNVDRSGGNDYIPFQMLDREGEAVRYMRGMADPYNLSWRADVDDRANVWFDIDNRKDHNTHFAYISIGGEVYTHELHHHLYADASLNEFISWLEEKYPDVEALKNAWNSTYQTFNSYTSISDVGLDISVNPEARPEGKQWDDPVYADLYAFARKLISDHDAFSISTFRKYDNNKQRIICSDWRHTQFRYALRYMDLMTGFDMQGMSYVENNFSWFGAEWGTLMAMQNISDMTGSPVIDPEWNIRALDADTEGVDSAWPYRKFVEMGDGVDTQAQRGASYALAIKQMAVMPGIIGQTWFHWFDCVAPGTGFPGNQGWVDGNSQPYQDFVEQASTVNHRLYMMDPEWRTYRPSLPTDGRLVSNWQCMLCNNKQNAGMFLLGLAGIWILGRRRKIKMRS